MIAYVVENPIFENGRHIGTARLYTLDKAKAEKIILENRQCTYRILIDEDIPDNVKANFLNS